MRIALVSPYDYSYPGGVTNHISHLKDSFVAMGHQVKIIAPSSKAPKDHGDDVIVCGKPTSIPASGSIARITLSLRLSSQVKKILELGNFDIVHLHEPLMPTLPITVLRFSKSVNIGTFHAQRDRSLAYLYGRRILKRWFRKLHGKIAVSKPAVEFVSQYFPGYYNIIPNGIEVEHFSKPYPPLEPFNDGKLNILFVGRMEPRKGLGYLLRAYLMAKAEMANTRLIIVGPDTPNSQARRRYEGYVARRGLEDVVFTGYVPYEELPRFYQTAHVFCAPATGFESQGLILLEAMAAGVPILASNIEGYASVFTHGAEGLLVPPKDEKALALALVHLLADRDLRQEMAERGRIKAQGYGWEQIAQKILAYYERILNEMPPQMETGDHQALEAGKAPGRLSRLISRWITDVSSKPRG